MPDFLRKLLWVGLALGTMAVGLVLDRFSLHTGIYVLFGAAGFAILLLPTRWAMQVLFLYIGVEGFLKMVSRYNPVVHVGADILVVTLTLRNLAFAVIRNRVRDYRFPPLYMFFVLHFIWFLIAVFNPYALSAYASL